MIRITDAGRGAYKPTEKNDCAVRAVAKVLRMPYRDAHQWLAAAGRQERHGISLMKLLYDAYVGQMLVKGRRIYFRFFHPDLPRYTVAEFLNAHKTGSYILQTKGHVFAMIDGIIYDDKKWAWEKALVISYCKFQ